MKTVITGIIVLLSLQLKAQDMKNPMEVVNQLFISTDEQNWSKVKDIFADQVTLDYSSMNSQPASVLAPQQIVSSWKDILPGFTSTHHQVSNFLVNEAANKAHVFCYGTAHHHLKDDNGDVWIVVGTYDFDLVNTPQQGWQITTMTFHFKYMDGNTSLPQKAMKNAQQL